MRQTAQRGFVAGACLLALLNSACTPSGPTTPTPSPTSTAPIETTQEREQREAYAAAEASYREFRAELYRVLGNGGAKSATSKMKATAAGPYLANFTQIVQAYRGQKSHSVGTEKAGYIRQSGYEPSALILDVCEDSRAVKDYSSSGKYQGAGEIRVVKIEVHKIDGTWKVWDGDGRKASSCD